MNKSSLILAWSGFLLGLGIAPSAVAKDAALPTRPAVASQDGDRGIPARFVKRRGRSPEWRQLKELEEYYDDLEDFYDKRDPRLADYYERMEKYYEHLRKGRPAYMPPEPSFEVAPANHPHWPLPESYRPPLPVIFERSNEADLQSNLERAYGELRGQLARLSTGDTWLRYLDLPLDTDRGATPSDILLTEEARKQLAERMRRFDSVAGDPTYRVIARLPAFGRTRNALRSFTRWLDQQPTLVESESVEEIPRPVPLEAGRPVEGPVLTPPQ